MWMAALLAALAAIGGAYNQNQTLKKQDNINAAALRRSADQQREANARVNHTIGQIAQSTPQAEAAKLQRKYTSQLDAAKQMTNQNLARNYLGDDYLSAASKAIARNSSEAGTNAALLSQIGAPAFQRQNESFLIGDAGTDIQGIERNSRGDANIALMRQRGVRPDPWLEAMTQAAGAYATSYGA